MSLNRAIKLSMSLAAHVFVGLPCAFGTLAATATISATPDGPNFDYTINLTDTGDTKIGTFWFAWTPPDQPIEYDFLPTAPLSASGPAGWTSLISPGFPGTSILYYNISGSDLSPSDTATFRFTSSDTPAALQGKAFGIFPITESFIYVGFPEVGIAARVNPVFVPEPGSWVLAMLAALGWSGAAAWRRFTRRRRGR